MNTNNTLFLFLQELFNRFVVKTAKYFKVWQWILSLLVAVTGLPGFLLMFNIHLPEFWEHLTNRTVAVASAGAWFMTLMTSQSKSVGIKGDSIKQLTDGCKLPFTAQHEMNKIIKNEQAKDTPAAQ